MATREAQMEIQKAYFTLPEILVRWSITETDLLYLAENDRIMLSVRVFSLPLEFGDIEDAGDGTCFKIPWEQRRYSGLLDLHAQDVFQLFRCGELTVAHFRVPWADYAALMSGTEPVLLMIGDLLLRREERDRLETETGFHGAAAGEPPAAIIASPDYQEVRCNGRDFHLGPIQAQVVRALHMALLAGDPWKSGKAILSAAGSKSMKMSDVFKSQPHWRALICSSRRGAYRLNAG